MDPSDWLLATLYELSWIFRTHPDGPRPEVKDRVAELLQTLAVRLEGTADHSCLRCTYKGSRVQVRSLGAPRFALRSEARPGLRLRIRRRLLGRQLSFMGPEELCDEGAALVGRFGVQRLLLWGGRLTLWGRIGADPERWLDLVSAAVQLAWTPLSGVGALRVAPGPGLGPLTAAPRPSDVRCPYCHDDLPPSAGVACATCGADHHTDCLRVAGCAIAGCRAGRGR